MENIQKLALMVESGARLLDEHKPDWHHRIVRTELDMSDALACILGQLYPNYGIGALILANRTGKTKEEIMQQHGFELPRDMIPLSDKGEMTEEEKELWDLLDAKWQDEITFRLQEEH